MYTIEELKSILKERKITYAMLSEMSNIPENTLKQIFRGRTKNPRMDTINAIITALGLDEQGADSLSSLHIPDSLKGVQVAFDGGLDGLTQADIDQIAEYVEFIKAKKKNN